MPNLDLVLQVFFCSQLAGLRLLLAVLATGGPSAFLFSKDIVTDVHMPLWVLAEMYVEHNEQGKLTA